MAIFQSASTPHSWQPSPLAAGPFQGLQGGAVAGLMVGELEAMAAQDDWGMAISISAWFLRPVPATTVRTRPSVLSGGGRITVADNILTAGDDDTPVATLRATFSRERAIDVPGWDAIAGKDGAAAAEANPQDHELRVPPAPHGRPWFMDNMEVRDSGTIQWFGLREPVMEGAGPMARTLGPADWTHGIGRPIRGAVGDPNPNLNVHLFRPPHSHWIGVRPQTHWAPERGVGMGRGVLYDVLGEIGSVSMSVALVPLPGAARKPA